MPYDPLASHNTSGAGEITFGVQSGRRGERETVTHEDIIGEMNSTLASAGEAEAAQAAQIAAFRAAAQATLAARAAEAAQAVQAGRAHEAAQLDAFIEHSSIVIDPEVLEVYHIIDNTAGQDVSIIPYIEAALINASMSPVFMLDELLVRLLIPAYKDGTLSEGLNQKVKHAIDSQPALYSDLQLMQGGRRRYKSKRHKRTSKKHKRTYKKYKRTSKRHK